MMKITVPHFYGKYQKQVRENNRKCHSSSSSKGFQVIMALWEYVSIIREQLLHLFPNQPFGDKIFKRAECFPQIKVM